jgi:very-short-patch-repair endonuclease
MGDRPHHDARRDAWLQAQGVRVLRFAAADVMNDLESVVTAITVACVR